VNETVKVRSLVWALSSLCVSVCVDAERKDGGSSFSVVKCFFFFKKQVKLNQGDEHKLQNSENHIIFWSLLDICVCHHAECVLVKGNASV